MINLPNISKWNIRNVHYSSGMFSCCKSLRALPDISKGNIDSLNDIDYMFSSCISLESLPDISKWDTII